MVDFSSECDGNSSDGWLNISVKLVRVLATLTDAHSCRACDECALLRNLSLAQVEVGEVGSLEPVAETGSFESSSACLHVPMPESSLAARLSGSNGAGESSIQRMLLEVLVDSMLAASLSAS
jgi:hypothetical protein